MKKMKRLLSAVMAALTLTACAMPATQVVRTDGGTSAAEDPIESGGSTRESTQESTQGQQPDDLNTKTDASTTGAKPEPGTSTDLTTTAQTTTAQTTIADTQAEATSAETKPVETSAGSTVPELDIKSNLPPEFQQFLSQPEYGFLIIYKPELFPEIKAITKWDVTDYNTNTQILLVLKDKDSRVEVTDSKLVDDERVVIPGDVIRDWDTTSDFEVIRIVFTDPETIPFNFIRVREPSGQVTTTPIHTSMRGNPDYELIEYDETE